MAARKGLRDGRGNTSGWVPGQSRRVIDFADQGIPDVLALGRYEYHAVQPALPAHAHPGAVEICYLERGCQTYRIEGREHRLVGGEVLIVPPGLLHDTGESPEDCGILYWLILRLPEDPDTLLHLSPGDSAAIADRLAGLPREKIVGSTSLKTMFRRLFDLHEAERSSLKPLSIRHQLLCCLLEVLRCADSGKGRVLSAAIRRTVRRIEREPQTDFSLEELAAEAALSLSRFKVKFKNETGMAPREFVLRVKMDHARRALARQDRSITAVAMALGFSSSQYFSTVFRRFTQTTPMEFRRRHAAPGQSGAAAASEPQASWAPFENVLQRRIESEPTGACASVSCTASQDVSRAEGGSNRTR